MQTEQSELDQKIQSLAAEMDEQQPYAYRIVRPSKGRVHIYRTKQYKYKNRTTDKIKTFKTLRQAHNYLGKVASK